jgi:hypothetical protein
MDIMDIAIVSAFNILCFVIGAKVGQTVSREEKIELPNLNPIQAIREAHDKREIEREKNRVEKIMQNIDAYDGTSNGQRDI